LAPGGFLRHGALRAPWRAHTSPAKSPAPAAVCGQKKAAATAAAFQNLEPCR
jgi:hypothetical protein